MLLLVFALGYMLLAGSSAHADAATRTPVAAVSQPALSADDAAIEDQRRLRVLSPAASGDGGG